MKLPIKGILNLKIIIVNNSWEKVLIESTPQKWIDRALKSLDILLLDHAHCEKKAATTIISLIHKYPEKNLTQYLLPVAREELLHFEQVTELLKKRGIPYKKLKSGPYARSLYQKISSEEPYRLKDSLLICALIEARSCERFQCLVPFLKGSVQSFYSRLYESESRHCELYLDLYTKIFKEDWSVRLKPLSRLESNLINKADPLFRFHSGF